jgi:hypothetical protein
MEAGCRAGGPSHRRRRTDDPDVDEPRSGIHEGLCDRPYRLRGYGVAVGVEQVGTGGADRGRNLVGDPGRSVRDKYAHQDVDPLDELRQRGGVLEAGVDGQRPSALTAASETRQRANAVGLQDRTIPIERPMAPGLSTPTIGVCFVIAISSTNPPTPRRHPASSGGVRHHNGDRTVRPQARLSGLSR